MARVHISTGAYGETLTPTLSQRERGFTLIELLVVITIIVILLALLVPAINKGIYAAELAKCGSQLKGTRHVSLIN